jgi:hypothetical protein
MWRVVQLFFSPVGGFQSFADVFSDTPIQFDEFLVAGSNDVILSGLDEYKDFGELGLQFICHEAETNFIAIIREF